jgi:hypothetical protein
MASSNAIRRAGVVADNITPDFKKVIRGLWGELKLVHASRC